MRALLVRFGRFVGDKILFLNVADCLIRIKAEIAIVAWASEKLGCEENERNELVAEGQMCLWTNFIVHEEISSKTIEIKAGKRIISVIIVQLNPALALSIFSRSQRLSWEFFK